MSLGKPTRPTWADGAPEYTAEPSAGKKSVGWLSEEKPPYQWMNWLFLKISEWLGWTEDHLGRVESLIMLNANDTLTGNYSLLWDPDNDELTFSTPVVESNYITIMFQRERGTFGGSGGLYRNSIAKEDSPLTIGKQQVVIAILKDATTALTQVAYGSLTEGTYAIVDQADLVENLNYHETILFRRRNDDILEIPPMKQSIFDDGATPVEFELGGRVGIDYPLINEGDMIYAAAGGGAERLPKGTAGQVLTQNADETAPEWQTPDRLLKWIRAELIGNETPITGVSARTFAALSSTDIAFIDNGNDDLRTYRFDGSDWAQVGSDLNIPGVGYPALAALSGTDVALVDSDGSNANLRTYRFNGSTWAQVGNTLVISGVGYSPALAALNSSDVAFIDEVNDDLRTYRFDGSDWAQVGNDLNIASVGTPALTALNETDVAFIDNSQDDLRLYRFDGSDWAQVGNDLNIASVGSPALAGLNGTDVAFVNNADGNMRVYRFDGSDWAQVGDNLNIAGSVGTPTLAGLNGTDVAFMDATNEVLATYRFSFYLENPHSVSGGAF